MAQGFIVRQPKGIARRLRQTRPNPNAALRAIKGRRKEFLDFLSTLSRRRLLALMGVASCIAYLMAERTGSIQERIEEGQKKYYLFPKTGLRLYGRCEISVSWLSDYLKKYWVGACHDREIVRESLDILEEWGCFSQTRTQQGSWRQRFCYRGNIPVICFLVEIMERCLVEQHKRTLDSVGRKLNGNPAHKNHNVRQLFNLFFNCWFTFCREEQAEQAIIIPKWLEPRFLHDFVARSVHYSINDYDIALDAAIANGPPKLSWSPYDPALQACIPY